MAISEVDLIKLTDRSKLITFADIELLIHSNISDFAKCLANYEMEFVLTSAVVNLALSFERVKSLFLVII